MYGIYLTVVKYKDHFIFAFAIFLSTFLLLNNDNPKMSVIRGKATEIVSFFSSPFWWIQSLMFLEEENQALREKNLILSLEVESMLNLQNENNLLMEMLDFLFGFVDGVVHILEMSRDLCFVDCFFLLVN